MKQENIKFTTAKSSMIFQLKELWKLVFGDADNYINLFFEHRFVPDQTMVALLDGVPVSMLFLLPITVCTNNEEYDAKYIYAVGTHPDYRSQGLSGKLLEATHERLIAEGVALSMLVPAEPSLFDYYGARGYKTQFYCNVVDYTADVCSSPVELRPVSLSQMQRLRDQCFGKSRLYARWNSKALSYQQKETELLGGEILSFFFPEEGYAVCYPTEDSVIIKEWAASSVNINILNSIAARYNRRQIWLRLAADMDKKCVPKPFAMTKWYISERTAQTGKAPYISLVLD